MLAFSSDLEAGNLRLILFVYRSSTTKYGVH